MSRLHPLEQRVLRTIRRYGLIAAGSTVVVAVSGGADSLALLNILHALAPQLGCRLHVATLDHRLRGQAGADDAAFVAAVAARLGLPCTAGERDVPAMARAWRMGTETAARRARYAFLAQVATGIGAECVATGHHADDQIETLLMRIIRGTGRLGLGGMRRSAPLPTEEGRQVRLIRPLLDERRAALAGYVEAKGLTPRHDTSNDVPSTLRNEVRHGVLAPLLRRFPHAGRHLLQVGHLSQIDEDYFDGLIAREYGSVTRVEGERLRIDRAAMRGVPQAVRLRLIKAAFQRLSPGHAIPFAHMMRCDQALVGGRVGSILEIEGYWRLRIDYSEAFLERWGEGEAVAAAHAPEAPLLPTDASITVQIPGETAVPGAGWTLVAAEAAPGAAASLYVPAGAAVLLRTRRPGDRFSPAGLGGHGQKIKQWMIDRKVPQSMRERVPLLEIDGQIAAICWGARWGTAEPFHADREGRTGGGLVHFAFRT